MVLALVAFVVLGGACEREGAPTTETRAALAASAPAALPAPAKEHVAISLFSWPGYGFWFVAQELGLAPELELDIQIIEDPSRAMR